LQFGRRTAHFESVSGETIAALEPELAGRFSGGLYFREEGHLDPRAALAALVGRLAEHDVHIRFGTDATRRLAARTVLDCTGLAARACLPDLRGVKGEMLVLRLPELTLHRPVRVLHPRQPLYVVPRGEGLFMVGATMIESDEATRVSARSMLELLSAAYALHPAFGEAQIIEIGTGVRAAFPDNLPRLRQVGGALHVNGLYRHGYLLAPALARRAADVLLEGRHYPEVMDEDPGERRLA
jgi:glycine oxidase